MGEVAGGLNVSQNVDGFLGAVLHGEPARALGQEGKTDHEEHARDELHTPGRPERRIASNERAAVADEVHDENAPLDGQLLDNDNGTALRVLRDLGKVHRYLRRRDADRDAVQHSSADQHPTTRDSSLERRPDEPEDAREEKGIAATELVRHRPGDERPDDGTEGQCSANDALSNTRWIVEEVPARRQYGLVV